MWIPGSLSKEGIVPGSVNNRIVDSAATKIRVTLMTVNLMKTQRQNTE